MVHQAGGAAFFQLRGPTGDLILKHQVFFPFAWCESKCCWIRVLLKRLNWAMSQVPIYTSRLQGTKSTSSPPPPPPPPKPTYERNPSDAGVRASSSNAAPFFASEQIGSYNSPPTSSPVYYKPHSAVRLKKSVIIPPHYLEMQ